MLDFLFKPIHLFNGKNGKAKEMDCYTEEEHRLKSLKREQGLEEIRRHNRNIDVHIQKLREQKAT